MSKNAIKDAVIVGLAIIGIIAVLVAYAFLHISTPAPKPGSFSPQTIGDGGGAQPKNAFVAATTTPCVIANSTATTSLTHFALNITTGTSSAGTIVIGTSTSPYATSTTPFATITVAAGAQIVYTWNGGVNNDLVYPKTYIVAGMTTASAVNYGYTYIGTCSSILTAD
jgi:hypothetical protein